MSPSTKKFFTSAEAAALLMVSAVTIREWARKGLLPSVSTAGGHRRFLLDSLRQFALDHGIHIESDLDAVAEQPRRVLLVDDDPIFADYLREIVLAAGTPVRVERAADGFEAGQLTEAFRPTLVAMDINMPKIDGIELCRRLRANPVTANARLVILSSALSDDHVAAARAAGANAWLEKGASRAEILRVLQLSTSVGAS
jgi:excisionase family DNA binding protein